MRRFLSVLIGVVVLACSPQLATASPNDSTTHRSFVDTVAHYPSIAPSVGVPDSVGWNHATTVPVTVQLSPTNPLSVVIPIGLFGFAFMGSINDTVADDKDSYPARQGLRAQFDNLVKDVAYALTHRPAWQVAAAAVAPPLLALATDVKTVKSTNTTQLMVNGVLTSLTATDPLMVVANMAASDPNVLAIGSVRKWQVCWDATNATTVITLRPSNDQIIANFASAALALAACRWPNLPPKGTVIVGVVSITNVTNVFTPGTTALNAAGVTMVVVDGPTQDCLLASLVSP